MSTENCHCGTDDPKFISILGNRIDGDNPITFLLYDSNSHKLVEISLLGYIPNAQTGKLNIINYEEQFIGFSTNNNLKDLSVNEDGLIISSDDMVLQMTPPDDGQLSEEQWFIYYSIQNDVPSLLTFNSAKSDAYNDEQYKLLQSIAYAYIQRPILSNTITLEIEGNLTVFLETQNDKLYHCDNNPFETIQRYDKLRSNITQAQTELLCKSNGILKGLGHIEAFIGMREHIRKLICMDESSLGADLDSFGQVASSVTEKNNRMDERL